MQDIQLLHGVSTKLQERKDASIGVKQNSIFSETNLKESLTFFINTPVTMQVYCIITNDLVLLNVTVKNSILLNNVCYFYFTNNFLKPAAVNTYNVYYIFDLHFFKNIDKCIKRVPLNTSALRNKKFTLNLYSKWIFSTGY